MVQQAETVIVGGGIWGLSTAYHLARAGHTDVCVLERSNDLSAETTPQAAGLVGQIRGDRAMREAVRYAVELLPRFARETGYDPGFHQVGSLLTALTPDRIESYEKQVEYANKNGVEAEFVEHSEMSRLAPGLDTARILGGYFVPKDGYVDPGECAAAFGAAAVDLGVRIERGARVTGLLMRNGRATGVEINGGRIEAENVVVTAGPWTAAIAQTAGVSIPVQPIRHQRVATVPMTGIPEHHPVVRVTDVSCYVRPERGGYLYGYFEPHPVSYSPDTVNSAFHTSDIEAPVDIMEEARERLAPIFPIVQEMEILEYKRGLTTFTPDGRYLVGPLPGTEGLYAATGCASMGIAGAAAVGRWLAEWIVKGEPGEDLDELRFDRFGKEASDPRWIREKSEEFYGNYYSIGAMS